MTQRHLKILVCVLGIGVPLAIWIPVLYHYRPWEPDPIPIRPEEPRYRERPEPPPERREPPPIRALDRPPTYNPLEDM